MATSFESELERYIQAGEMASSLKPFARRLVSEDASIIEICEAVEQETRRLGGEPPFPVNVCVGDVAAHFTAPPCYPEAIREGSLVKVDFGAMLDGYMVDTAVTVNLSPMDSGIVRAAEAALGAGVKAMKTGVTVGEVGGAIQRISEAAGFRVLRNLTGHQMTRYNLHAGGHIPNVGEAPRERVKPYTVYAVEPFLTYSYGAGWVVERRPGVIFRLTRRPPPIPREAGILFKISRSFRELPFAERWLGLSDADAHVLNDLVKKGYLYAYPVLVEAKGAPVAQAEASLAVLPEKTVILTS